MVLPAGLTPSPDQLQGFVNIASHTFGPAWAWASGFLILIILFGLLICVTLLSGLLAGYAMAKRKSRSWLHMLLYALVAALTIYAVLDLEYPRFGLIRLDAADKALIDLRNSIR